MSMQWKDLGSNTAKDVGSNPTEVYTILAGITVVPKKKLFFLNQRLHWEVKKITLLLNSM